MNIPLPDILKQVVTPTEKDAMYVPIDPNQKFPWSPMLPVREIHGFATRAQVNALIEYLVLLTFDSDQRPDLQVTDTGENHVYAPFCKLKYFNDPNDDNSPRIYTITGTFPTPSGPMQTIIDVGSFLEINRDINMPDATRIQMVVKNGGVFPEWRND